MAGRGAGRPSRGRSRLPTSRSRPCNACAKGGRRSCSWPAGAVARHRIWLRDHHLFCGRAGARYPIKKWAALAALGAAAFYLLLSGAEVATQRSFIMIAIVLIGVVVDRPTLTFRTLTVAAFCVLLLAPEAIIHPSFQMSFAATLALVAGYQQGLPDVLIAAGGNAVALRGESGRLSMVKYGSDVFAFREWLAADADARTPTDRTLGEGIRCDAAGCIGKLKDRSLVAIAKTLEAFEEDCRRAVLVVSSRDAPPGCAALVIDRGVWRRSGALTLHRRGEQFEITAARPPGYDRPWARAAAPAGEALEPSRTTPARPRDATPRQDDLEAGD